MQVFFGTPHRGSDIAKTLGSIHKMTTSLSFGWMVESKFVGMLTTHSDDLLEVSADFLHCANRYALISFYEQHIHPRLRKLVSPVSCLFFSFLFCVLESGRDSYRE